MNLACILLTAYIAYQMTHAVHNIIKNNPYAKIQKCGCFKLNLYDVGVVALGTATEAILIYIFVKMCQLLSRYKLVSTRDQHPRAGYQQI
ncbi:hypothetical protein D6_00232 [Faustovirus]|nr:hypothetical protein D6_00232 [Faustovirus]AMP44230.1 hypothetical protein PRJ_Dakar_00275 [Faustovirus]